MSLQPLTFTDKFFSEPISSSKVFIAKEERGSLTLDILEDPLSQDPNSKRLLTKAVDILFRIAESEEIIPLIHRLAKEVASQDSPYIPITFLHNIYRLQSPELEEGSNYDPVAETGDKRKREEGIQEAAKRMRRQASFCFHRLSSEWVLAYRLEMEKASKAYTLFSQDYLDATPGDIVMVAEGEEFKVHQSVLEQYPYWQAMLKDWKEGRDKRIDVPFSPTILKALIEFLYSHIFPVYLIDSRYAQNSTYPLVAA